MVPQARLERARPCERQILNLLRLPIPPLGHWSKGEGGSVKRALRFCQIGRTTGP
jgi:hypothetical protein